MEDGIITKKEKGYIDDLQIQKPSSPKNFKGKVNNDTITLTWSNVPDAVYYEITDIDENLVYLSEKNTLVIKDVKTGNRKAYRIKAAKYHTMSEPVWTTLDVPEYYKPISGSELWDFFSVYVDKTIKLSSMQVEAWTIKSPEGDYDSLSTTVVHAKYKDDYDVCVLCKASKYNVIIVLKNYRGWGWENYNNDFLSRLYSGKVKTITVKGTVQKKRYDWITKKTLNYKTHKVGEEGIIPMVIINKITWN